MTNSNPLADLDLFYGELKVNRAIVYARLPLSEATTGATLTGQMRGPRSALAQSLPTTAKFVDLGPGDSLLSRALVTDPGFWTSDNPALYDVAIELHRNGQLIASEKRTLAFRPIGTRGIWITREEHPWVIRGVIASSSESSNLDDWRAASAAYMAREFVADELNRAAEIGVYSLVQIRGDQAEVIDQLHALAHQPAVAIAVIESAAPTLDDRISQLAPNLLLAQYFRSDQSVEPAAWAQIVVVEVADPATFAEKARESSVPVVSFRPLVRQCSVADARAACDHLQRDLAPFGQYAGYIV
jgi:hypothetical protein